MKRIRIELDVNDAVDVDALRWADVLGRSATSQQATIAVRSVEVVEPERWTELVLRGHKKGDYYEAGDLVFLWGRSDTPRSPWTVLSCTEREEYPSAAE